MPQRLHHTGAHIADGSHRVQHAEHPHSYHADLDHFIGGVEQTQELRRESAANDRADCHHHDAVQVSIADGFVNSHLFLRAQIVGDNGDGCAAKGIENGVEEVRIPAAGSENGDCRRGEPAQHGVEVEHHKAVEHEQHSRGNTEIQHIFHRIKPGLYGKAKLHLSVLPEIQAQGDKCGNNLAEHRCHGCAGNSHLGKAEQTENQNRVKNNVQQCSCCLRDHTVQRFAGGNQHSLKHKLSDRADSKEKADPKILNACFQNFRVCGLGAHECAGERRKADRKRQNSGQQHEEYGSRGRIIDFLLLPFSQCTGEHRVHADGNADSDRCHEGEHRHGIGDGGQGFLADHGNENAVHNVVKRLYRRGQNDGQGHFQEQRPDRRCSHFVFGDGFAQDDSRFVFRLTMSGTFPPAPGYSGCRQTRFSDPVQQAAPFPHRSV